MMARLVALMDSMRPTVRRVTNTLATPASTNINKMHRARAVLILSVNSSRSSMSFPTSKWLPSGSVSNVARRSSGRPSRALNSPHPLEPFMADGQSARLPASGANEGSASR